MTDVFDAIADGVRRQILVRLAAAPLTVNQVVDMFAISRPAISRHLRILRESGLVAVELKGRQRWCRVQTERLAEVEQWLNLFANPWPQRLDALATEVARTKRDRRMTPAPATSRAAQATTQSATRSKQRRDTA